MPIRLGPATFEDHISIEIVPNKWTDTFIVPVHYDWALPPWDYAAAVRTVFFTLKKLRPGASVWVPVTAPGKWYFDEVKYALRNSYIPVAVTQSRRLPQLSDFSQPPGIFEKPCFGYDLREPWLFFGLKQNALRTLLVLARFTTAFTNEIQCSTMIGERATLDALRALSVNGYIQHHLNDPNVDAHLLARINSERFKTKRSLKWNGEHWAYWRITKPGFRSALRIWGVPTGKKFRNHLEKTPLLNGQHRRRSRQWPLWVQRALPHAEIYAGWNEVIIPELRARPDGLAWGKIDQAETLFWLEVETTKSRGRVEQATALRWAKAKGYAEAVGVRLVFVVMGMPWVQNAAQGVFTEIPPNCAVIVTGWHRLDFGKLPYPKWGELVAARYSTSRKHSRSIT